MSCKALWLVLQFESQIWSAPSLFVNCVLDIRWVGNLEQVILYNLGNRWLALSVFMHKSRDFSGLSLIFPVFIVWGEENFCGKAIVERIRGLACYSELKSQDSTSMKVRWEEIPYFSISMRYRVLGSLGFRIMGTNWWPHWISEGK